MSSLVEKAEQTEQEIHLLIDGQFDLPKAVLYSVNKTDEGKTVIVKVGEHGDVYELLESSDSSKIAKVSDFVAVLTCGWASPITKKDDSDDDDDDNHLAPSQHPERRRVRLVVLASKSGVASVLRFSDKPDEIVSDSGNARGSLADAVSSLYQRGN